MRSARGRAARSVAAAAALVTAATLAGCGVKDGGQEPGSNGALGAQVRFFVDPTNHAATAATALRVAGRQAAARELSAEIGDRPSAVWLTPVNEAVYSQAQAVTQAAEERQQLPVLVAYNLPGRDCGQYSSGGAADIDAYLDWLGSMAAGIGERPAVVVLEPDAIALTLEGCTSGQSAPERYRMLKEAVTILKRQPKVKIYLDAGNASWIGDLDALAGALRAAGIGSADGFALNVSNFETTARSVRYGDELSRRLEGAHYVVDTSRNGAGPPQGAGTGHRAWCNPPGVRLGTPPTTRTAHPLVDAYLWVKQPGDSDGACGAGAPAAGTWWGAYASELTKNTP
ncbi:MAG TPA: glycoside hydrolase family 6 protein [Nocardioidaceae bacterium]|nr:glycoside hydrolase family 6 protein [Nocardioidaceae bacterium]